MRLTPLSHKKLPKVQDMPYLSIPWDYAPEPLGMLVYFPIHPALSRFFRLWQECRQKNFQIDLNTLVRRSTEKHGSSLARPVN